MAAATTRKRDSKLLNRETFDVIKVKTKEIIQSRKNANQIIDIFTYLEVSTIFNLMSTFGSNQQLVSLSFHYLFNYDLFSE